MKFKTVALTVVRDSDPQGPTATELYKNKNYKAFVKLENEPEQLSVGE